MLKYKLQGGKFYQKKNKKGKGHLKFRTKKSNLNSTLLITSKTEAIRSLHPSVCSCVSTYTCVADVWYC